MFGCPALMCAYPSPSLSIVPGEKFSTTTSAHPSNGSINSGVHGGSRSIAGQIGARASGLLEYLVKGHYGVDLPPEDFHRITLWLDCNSEFYGAYRDTEAQARGQIVMPELD